MFTYTYENQIRRNFAEERETITRTLALFKIRLSTKDKKILRNTLKFPCRISMSEWLDIYLISIIPQLYADHMKIDRQYEKFRGLLSGCFTGNFSQKVWDELWKYLNDYEKIFYTTSNNYHWGNPVELALKAGNLESLERLDQIYQDLLDDNDHLLVSLHANLSDTLTLACQYQCISKNPQKVQECFLLLLEMCGRYTVLINSEDYSHDFANMKFMLPFYGDKNKPFYGYKDKPLLEYFLDTCGWLCREKNFIDSDKIITWTIYQIYKYACQNTSYQALINFQNKIFDFIKENKAIEQQFEILVMQNDKFTLKSKSCITNANETVVLSENHQHFRPI